MSDVLNSIKTLIYVVKHSYYNSCIIFTPTSYLWNCLSHCSHISSKLNPLRKKLLIWDLHKEQLHFAFFYFFLIYLLLAILGPCCYPQAFSGCGEWALLSSCRVRASHLSSFSGRAWALGHAAFSSCSSQTLVLVHRLSCSVAQGIFSDMGSNPWLLRGQRDSLPLTHQRGPTLCFLTTNLKKKQRTTNSHEM